MSARSGVWPRRGPVIGGRHDDTQDEEGPAPQHAPPGPRRRGFGGQDRERYKQHGGSSGDDLAARLRKHLETDDGSVDLAKLRALAEANGVWRDR